MAKSPAETPFARHARIEQELRARVRELEDENERLLRQAFRESP